MLGAEEKRALKRAIDRNHWPLAEEGKLLEQELAAYVGVNHSLLANSGSSAGLLALLSLELPRGSEVIIPATTFPTIFNIIVQCNLVPVVVDCEVGTYNIDLSSLEQAITEKTKAIIAVHAVGNPCDMPAIMKLAAKYYLYVIEDNCDGFGSTIAGSTVGSFGHLSFTSFHAAHIVSMGQGGGVFTNSGALARRVRMYRDWGRQSDIEGRTNNDKWPDLPADYDSRFIYERMGYNLSPLDIQAAMGRVQLKKIGKIKKLRQKNFNYLYEHLNEFEQRGLVMPRWLPEADVCWFAFPLSYHDRGRLVAHLEDNGIETRSMFAGNILKHPAYKNVEHRSMLLTNSNRILKDSFWVSVHPSLTKDDLHYMVKVFNTFFEEYD